MIVDASAPMALEQALRSALAVPNMGPRPARSWGDISADYLVQYRVVVDR